MINKEKVLILDYSKWICGMENLHNDGIYKGCHTGKGDTALLNKEGYMCCLGQFALQLSNEIEEKDILYQGEPDSLACTIPLLSRKSTVTGWVINTDFSKKAMNINDDVQTKVTSKIVALRKLCARHKYKLKVINKPK